MTEALKLIEKLLRTRWGRIVEEPIPEDMQKLLDKLDASTRR